MDGAAADTGQVGDPYGPQPIAGRELKDGLIERVEMAADLGDDLVDEDGVLDIGRICVAATGCVRLGL